MSAPAALPPLHNDAPAPRNSSFTLGRIWKTGAVVAVIMVVLALIGVGLITARSTKAREYWVVLVPVYGLLCIVTAWLRSRHDATFGLGMVGRQLLHWLGVGGAVALDFYVRGTGDETSIATGFNALLLLAVGCFLAGVHFEWLFMPVGLLLGLTLICAVKAQQYLWLILVIGVLALVIAFAVYRTFGRSRPAGGAATTSP